MKKRLAFTLIEMLTVIAITAVLLTLIVVPIFQSFNMTRAAQAFADAQERGRILTERLSREIANSTMVRDTNYTFNGYEADKVIRTGPAHSCMVPIQINGTSTVYEFDYTKLDIVPPAQGDPTKLLNGAYINPVTGKADPTLRAPKGQVNFPVAPGLTVVRYAIGLRDPFGTYNNPYDGLLMARNGGRDNLVALYRFEFPLNIFVNGSLVPNPALFYLDSTGAGDIDNPYFLIPDRDKNGDIAQTDKNARIYHWMHQLAPWESATSDNNSVLDAAHNTSNFAKVTMLTEVSRYDMIQPMYDKASRQLRTQGGKALILPTIQFRPTLVSNDPAKGFQATRLGEETDNAKNIAPDTYQTQFGGWSNVIVRNYAAGYTVGDLYQVVSHYNAIFAAKLPVGGSADGVDERYMLFDLDAYNNTANYPFTQAGFSAEYWDILHGGEWINNQTMRDLFGPFTMLWKQGKIVTSFGIDEVGSSFLLGGAPNLPVVNTGDPNDTSASSSFSPVTASGSVDSTYTVNQAYNRAVDLHPELKASLRRFIDLRVIANQDGTLPPLFPFHITDTMTGLRRCRITPGTEVVYGPDQTLASLHQGVLDSVRYTRVTGAPGPNQYRINYVDLTEPNYANYGLPDPPPTYDPTNFVSAVFQPRFKAGYIEFDSDPTVQIPAGQIKVSYRFQFTGAITPDPAAPVANQLRQDIFSVDYDTRQMISVLLTMRNYPQSNQPNPQTVTLKATATVRNLIR